jgi:hypothetical protein
MSALPPPLTRLPWDPAKDEFGRKALIFLGIMGTLILRAAKDQFRPYPIAPSGFSSRLPPASEKTSSRLSHIKYRTAPDATEFHQLERRRVHLGVRDPQRQRRLLASLTDSGQQVPSTDKLLSERSFR